MKQVLYLLGIMWLPLCGTRVEAGSRSEVSRLKTFSVVGKERPDLNGYREAELLQHDGRGCLTHMWFGGDWPHYDKTVIRVYVDGERRASIETPATGRTSATSRR